MATSITNRAGRFAEKSLFDKRIGWGLTQLSLVLGVSRNFLRDEVMRGRLRAKKLGRRVIVLDTDLRKYLHSRPTKFAS